jgi:hypothetical protein
VARYERTASETAPLTDVPIVFQCGPLADRNMSEPIPLTTEERQKLIDDIRDDIVTEIECDWEDEQGKAQIALGALQSCDRSLDSELWNVAVRVLLGYLRGHPCKRETDTRR